MQGDEEYPALKATQISFLDHPELIGTARYGIKRSPAQVAAVCWPGHRVLTERSVDDLDYYEFLGIETPLGLLGLRMHIGSPMGDHSVVSWAPRSDVDAKDVISRVCGVDRSEIEEFGDNW